MTGISGPSHVLSASRSAECRSSSKIMLCCLLRYVPMWLIVADHVQRRFCAHAEVNVCWSLQSFRPVTCLAQWRTLDEVPRTRQYMFPRYNRWKHARILFSRPYFPYRTMNGLVIPGETYGRINILTPTKFSWAYILACSHEDGFSSRETPSNFPI